MAALFEGAERVDCEKRKEAYHGRKRSSPPRSAAHDHFLTGDQLMWICLLVVD